MKKIILAIAFFGVIWLLPIIQVYSYRDALIITISSLVGGYIGQLSKHEK